MKTNFLLAATVSAMVFAAMATLAATGSSVSGQSTDPDSSIARNCAAMSALPPSNLSESEKQGILFMREEEKLARDVYVAMAAKWDIPVFTNISQSETRHMESMLALIERYNLVDPVTDDGSGEFADANLKNLYQVLIKQGNNSLVDALRAGALIEETDIADLQKNMDKTDNADIKQVYENLLQASYRHLRAFTRNLAMRNMAYVPQVLTEAEFEDINNE